MDKNLVSDALKRGESVVFVDGKADSSGQTVFFDEYGYYAQALFNDDRLKEELRNVQGIPNATYLVEGEQVFVFDKLLQLVKDRRKAHPEVSLGDLAARMVGEATVSAVEAVRDWNVVAEPYEVVDRPDGGDVMIRHRQFNARIPEVFKDREAAQGALVCLLLGIPQPTGGDFVYRGQALSLCDPLDPVLLPPRPAFHVEPLAEPSGYMALRSLDYRPGFDPVSRDVFDKVKELSYWWHTTARAASLQASRQAADVWRMVVGHPTGLQLSLLDDKKAVVPGYAEQEGAELRNLYPELSMLSDGALYDWYDRYQSEYCFARGWTPIRDDEFLFYLLGKVAWRFSLATTNLVRFVASLLSDVEREHSGEAAVFVGRWSAYALLRGDDLAVAFAFGKAAQLYDLTLATLAHRIADAMHCLAYDEARVGQRGSDIKTFNDFVRSARGGSMRTVIAEQVLGDFATALIEKGAP